MFRPQEQEILVAMGLTYNHLTVKDKKQLLPHQFFLNFGYRIQCKKG
jgi:hypothetical protein